MSYSKHCEYKKYNSRAKTTNEKKLCWLCDIGPCARWLVSAKGNCSSGEGSELSIRGGNLSHKKKGGCRWCTLPSKFRIDDSFIVWHFLLLQEVISSLCLESYIRTILQKSLLYLFTKWWSQCNSPAVAALMNCSSELIEFLVPVVL